MIFSAICASFTKCSLERNYWFLVSDYHGVGNHTYWRATRAFKSRSLKGLTVSFHFVLQDKVIMCGSSVWNSVHVDHNVEDVRMLCFVTAALNGWAGFMKNAYSANTDACDP